jgi:hypothetical protein
MSIDLNDTWKEWPRICYGVVYLAPCLTIRMVRELELISVGGGRKNEQNRRVV